MLARAGAPGTVSVLLGWHSRSPQSRCTLVGSLTRRTGRQAGCRARGTAAALSLRPGPVVAAGRWGAAPERRTSELAPRCVSIWAAGKSGRPATRLVDPGAQGMRVPAGTGEIRPARTRGAPGRTRWRKCGSSPVAVTSGCSSGEPPGDIRPLGARGARHGCKPCTGTLVDDRHRSGPAPVLKVHGERGLIACPAPGRPSEHRTGTPPQYPGHGARAHPRSCPGKARPRRTVEVWPQQRQRLRTTTRSSVSRAPVTPTPSRQPGA